MLTDKDFKSMLFVRGWLWIYQLDYSKVGVLRTHNNKHNHLS